jgi:hypothetical protein
MSIEKDRPGALRQHAKGKRIADLHLDSDPDNHALTWALETPDTAESDDGTIKPTAVMEKISRLLEANPQGLSKRSIRAGVHGSNDVVDLALELLQNGHVAVAPYGSAHLHTSTKPYREASR